MLSAGKSKLQASVAASGLFELNQEILRLMWMIDREATPVDGDYPTGLWYYAGHLDRDGTSRKVLNSEVCWSHRLSEMLNAEGCTCHAESRYPRGSRQRCDVVFNVGRAQPFWLEVKGSWRAKFDPPAPNTAYLKHLAAADDDVGKLMSLTPQEACGIAFVLAGFDQPAEPITEKHLSIIRERTGSSEWQEASAHWNVAGRVSFRVHCWIWSRWL